MSEFKIELCGYSRKTEKLVYEEIISMEQVHKILAFKHIKVEELVGCTDITPVEAFACMSDATKSKVELTGIDYFIEVGGT